MKYIKIIVVFCAIMVLMPDLSFAQDATGIDINAIVAGSDNEPIEGAVVSQRSTGAMAVTDASGAFNIVVADNSLLLVSAVGYKDLTVMATDNLDVITLESDLFMVKMPFREVEKSDIIGGVDVVNIPDLLRINYTSNPIDGLNTIVGGFNGNSIWGMDGFLIVVDGIPRDITNFRTTEIEQITVLKGASAVALYGTHAANGVLYITTKRGADMDQRVDVRINSGMHVPKRFPNYVGAADYMMYYSEAQVNDGLSDLRYSQEDVDNTRSGHNPIRYPDVDFYSSDFLKNAYNRSDVTTEIYGGDENARYYTNIGFMREGSLLDFGEGENSHNYRFNLRGNVDVDLNRWLSGYVDAGVVLSSNRGPQTNYFEQAAIVRPNRFSPLIPVSMIDMSNDDNRVYVENTENFIDGRYILGGSQLDPTNPFADVYAGGHNTAVNRQFLFNGGLDADLSGITSGLAFRTKVGVDYSTSYNQGYNHQYQVFESHWVTEDGIDFIESITPWGLDDKSNVQYVGGSWYQQLIYFSGQFDYRRSYDNRHNLFTMLVANGYQYSVSGVYHKTNNTNLGYFLGYNYLNRYYLDFNGSLMYTTRLHPDNRLAFSPTLSLGWRMSDESFMDGATFVDNLKLNATVGRIYSDYGIEAEVDDNVLTHYLYTNRYNYRGTNWYSWAAEMGIDVTASLRGENPDLEAPYRDEISFGISATLFNRLLDIDANYFSITHVGGVVQAINQFPVYMMTGWPASSFVPYVNYNEERRTGYDFNLRLNRQIGNTALIFGVTGTYYDSEILKRDDIYEFDYQEREGRPIDGIWGLVSDGFFADDTDIANSPSQAALGEVRPGDIKYVDQNGDGIIDSNDAVFLGKGGWFGAPYTMGLNLTAKWRNLTFYAQGIGRWGAYGMKNRTTDWVRGEGKYSDVVHNRWASYTHPFTGEVVDTRETATYPRLTAGSGDNNFRNSDFWLYSTDRFDITRLQITYSLPQNILDNTFFRNVDIYVGGSNLVTISPEKKYLETNVGQWPQTRFYNLGVSASF